MTLPPQFSVIIPTHNRLLLLRRALASVRNQTFRDYELIVVDDGSSDRTWNYLSSLVPSIKALRQENRGPGPARNLGAMQATGRYLAFLDSDDVWFPWTLATLSELVRRHGNPSILSGKLVEFWDEAELEAFSQGPVAACAFADYLASSKAQYFVGAGMMVLRREVFLNSGGFIGGWLNCEDHDLILRLGSAPGFVQILSPTTIGWYRHAASETGSHRRTISGILHMIKQERQGIYPGGKVRAHARREILTLHTRPVTLSCLGANLVADAWRLYLATLIWNWRLARWKYLGWFPMLALSATLRSRWVMKREPAHS